ncbi:VanZ like protein [Algoriphagus aquaeductus]|uniref:VanZ like protein n=2 Tax=Algoriphagus aquaeductus TaxID=475299 RepID=A0A326RWB1_9BACT|nr:VanZ like protein [Algoriphagus aquaeductus]
MLSPGTSFPEVDLFDLQDKLIHLVCFFIQAYLWCGIGVEKSNKGRLNKRVWINFLLFGILIGAVFETAQYYIPFRSFDWMDMTVNMIGGILGLLGYLKWPTIKFILD